MNQRIQVKLLNLETIVERKLGFVVPCYQRPYVWQPEDAIKLFDDIKNAFCDMSPHYFIGSVLSAKNTSEDGTHRYALIDGQQRITTLMLICMALTEQTDSNGKLRCATILDNKPRLEFAIRPDVYNLLGSYAGLENCPLPSPEKIEKNAYLRHLNTNLIVLRNKVADLRAANNNETFTKGFCNYIYTQVRWLNNQVSSSLDLNRLFYSINMGGVQLQPTDLLKSQLLRRIKDDKLLYGTIWDACENTQNYFERNLRNAFDYQRNNMGNDDLHAYSSEKFKLINNPQNQPYENTAGKSIDEIARSTLVENKSDNSEKDGANSDDEDSDKIVHCRSIISFDLLLIHTLRIFSVQHPEAGLGDVVPRIKKDNLLASFDLLLEKDESLIKKFILLLWQVRYQFDLWVVKWINPGNEQNESLRLTYISSSKGELRRSSKEVSDLVQLQSVCNFTGERSAQYWLTPFLGWLVASEMSDESLIASELERIDNQLSMTSQTQKEASYALLKGDVVEVYTWDEQAKYFTKNLGTGFEHYWFQKLEYVLWKELNKTCKDDSKLKKFHITSKNSVEHVHPQHEENGNKLDDDLLHNFGNLALLSPGENSSYSNQTFKKKMADFEDKQGYDSLKLKEIFEFYKDTKTWTDRGIGEHQNKMVKLLADHYDKGM